ncbi:hypothetical protein OAJ30_01060 [Alphaproteobacteria bacterium]|nr:hypothetical protein [Alphaproteobacteria bacterium]
MKTFLTLFVLFFSTSVYANVTEDLVGKNVKVFFNDGNSCVFSIHEDSKVSADCMPDVPVKYKIVEGKKIKFIMWGPYTTKSGLSKSVAIYYNTSSNFMISTLLDDTDAKWETLDIKDVEISEIANKEITPNENVNNIFFKVVSKDKIIDVDGEEACLTKFEVTNNSIYTIHFQEIIPFHIGPKKYKWGSEMSNLVNPDLKKKEVDKYDEYIDYFTIGMTANIQGDEAAWTYGENSSVINYIKCKRIKVYVIELSCESVNAEAVLDSNEDSIQWESNKEAYRKVLNLLSPHPEHDEGSFGKIKFDRLPSC